MLPKADWKSVRRASFPFEYMRYSEFCSAARSLIVDGQCGLFPYDWESGTIEDRSKIVRRRSIAIVEGTSSLNTELAPLYDLRIWVESEPGSMCAAAVQRDVGGWACEWNAIFTPSVAFYLETEPRKRADIIARGRAAPESAN